MNREAETGRDDDTGSTSLWYALEYLVLPPPRFGGARMREEAFGEGSVRDKAGSA